MLADGGDALAGAQDFLPGGFNYADDAIQIERFDHKPAASGIGEQLIAKLGSALGSRLGAVAAILAIASVGLARMVRYSA